MRPSSAKAKGRKLQQWFANKMVEILGLDKEDLESRPMGSQGEDIIMGKQSRDKFPYSIECKNQEAVNLWKAYAQAEENCKGYEHVSYTHHTLPTNHSLPFWVVTFSVKKKKKKF